MSVTYIRFYVHENRRHHHHLAYEWLLEQAKKMGLHGGSAFRAIAGYGRHGVIHEDHFFELQGDLPVMIEFIISDEEAEQLLTLLENEQLSLFYIRFTAESGLTGNGCQGG